MIFKLFSRKKTVCGTCGDDFQEIPPVEMSSKSQIKVNLLESKFRCPKCDLVFHGKCGHVGGASPTNAIVTCAGCKHSFQQRLPFVILRK